MAEIYVVVKQKIMGDYFPVITGCTRCNTLAEARDAAGEDPENRIIRVTPDEAILVEFPLSAPQGACLE